MELPRVGGHAIRPCLCMFREDRHGEGLCAKEPPKNESATIPPPLWDHFGNHVGACFSIRSFFFISLLAFLFELSCFYAYVCVCVFCAFEKGAKMELPEGGWTCYPTMPVHVS